MKRREPVTGQELINAFQTAFLSISATEAAQFEAERSESEFVAHLRDISHGTLLQPGALSQDDPDLVTRASLDAHVKKVQAEQFAQVSLAQLQQLQAEVQTSYRGRKVRISVLDISQRPVDAIWYDPHSDGYHTNTTRRREVRGVIQEVILEKNALVIQPTAISQLVNARLQNFVAYIINPSTGLPMVRVDIL